MRKDPQSFNESGAANALPLFYDEVRALAAKYLRRERKDHTLQPTALVHEAYLRLIEQNNVDWKDRVQFFAAAAAAIRRVLVNYAIARKAQKRGGMQVRHEFNEAAHGGSELGDDVSAVDLVLLDEALQKLADMDDRQSRIVELRFFGGLTVEETAEVLDLSPRSVRRDWRMAKAWLHREITRGEADA